MPELTFPLAVFALVIASLAARIAVSRRYFSGLPTLPREN